LRLLIYMCPLRIIIIITDLYRAFRSEDAEALELELMSIKLCTLSYKVYAIGLWSIVFRVVCFCILHFVTFLTVFIDYQQQIQYNLLKSATNVYARCCYLFTDLLLTDYFVMAHWRYSNRMIIKLDRYLTRKKFNGIDFESKLSERCWESRGRANNRPPTFSTAYYLNFCRRNHATGRHKGHRWWRRWRKRRHR